MVSASFAGLLSPEEKPTGKSTMELLEPPMASLELLDALVELLEALAELLDVGFMVI